MTLAVRFLTQYCIKRETNVWQGIT